ncbi:MAG: carotenoid oxygenase family protein [Anaerolineales bacterium]|nr:carotenoid oxygenase family protein [Anaerolineales bacterium]
MGKQQTSSFVFKNIYPRFRHILLLGRKLYHFFMTLQTSFSQRPASSPVLPDAYTVLNTSTFDSEMDLHCLEGEIPDDIEGSLFICQCLGSPEAFMVGDTNIIRMDFEGKEPRLTNRLMWTPTALARHKLKNTRHRFDFFGLMYLSPGMGMSSYTEGLYLLPDGRLGVTSDVDRPWVIERDSLQAVTPVGRRDEWLPMLADNAGEVMGGLFAGYNNSHVLYTDHEKAEVFLVNYRLKRPGSGHPVKLIRWDGYHDFESWIVVDGNGAEIEIKQSIHELVFTRDYILLADTAFVAGTEMFTPWKNLKLPYDKTVIYIIDRRDLKSGRNTVLSKQIVVDKPCIHLIPEYENPNDKITVYMLHTPATNTAEILRSYDRDLDGKLFPKHLTGYGTLPVLDLSSVGKHVIDVPRSQVVGSEYISEMPYCWGPYLYTYMGRQIEPYHGQDLFIMFKGFSRDILPKRIYNAYKNVDARQVPLEDMVGGEGFHHNNSICRVTTKDFAIADAYVFPDRTLLYTIATLDSKDQAGAGYIIAGVVSDRAAGERSSGHEYWIFNASNLAKGPICRLGHESLNNATLFHAVYIPRTVAKKLDQKKVSYQIPIRADYPREDLEKWDSSILECFEDVIWPLYDHSDPEATQQAKEIAGQLAAPGNRG